MPESKRQSLFSTPAGLEGVNLGGEVEQHAEKVGVGLMDDLRADTIHSEEMNIDSVLSYGAKTIDSYTKALIDRASAEKGNGDLVLRIMKVRSYFLSAENSRKESPLRRIARLYDTLQWPTDAAEIEEYKTALTGHFKILIERAFDQHLENPEQYVSHGFDHSLHVANYAEEVVAKFPEIIANIMASYRISEGEAKFLVQNVALFHDCGYCSLAEGATKAVHSLASVGIIMEPEYRDNMRTLVRGGSPEQQNQMFYDLEGAVLFHNADKVDRAFTSKVVTTRGEYIALADEQSILKVISSYSKRTSGEERSMGEIVIEVKNGEVAERIRSLLTDAMTSRGLDIRQMPDIRVETTPGSDVYLGRSIDIDPGDKTVGLEYRPADTLDYSLLAVLRVADNMDVLPERFSETQQMPAFKDICKLLGDQISPESQCLKVLEHSKDSNAVSEAVIDFLRHANAEEGLTLQELSILSKIMEYTQTLETSRGFANDKEELALLIKQFSIYKILKRYNLSNEESENLQRIGKLQTSESFRHFGGCDSILSIRIDSGDTPDQAVIYLTVEKETFDYLQQFSVEEKTRDKSGNLASVAVPIGEYQIWRLTEALQSNKHGKRPIELRVFDDAGNELTNLFSLKEKHPKAA